MKVVKRPYQVRGENDLRASYGLGKKAPMFVLATGGGKTVTFAGITEGAAAKGKCVLIIAHRRELIKQASRKLDDIGVRHGIIAPGHSQTSDLVHVGSIQTVVRRLDKIPRFDLIIIDECFPAGTLIDGIPIETIKTGDFVRTFDENTMRITIGRVGKLYKKNTDAVVSIRTKSGRHIVATPNHPILTSKGWTNAGAIAEGCELYVSTMRGVWSVCDIPEEGEMGRMEVERENVLHGRMPRQVGVEKIIGNNGKDKPQARFPAHDGAQPNALRGKSIEDEGNSTCDRSQAAHPRGQWCSDAYTAATPSGGAWSSVGEGARCLRWDGEIQRMARSLQDRHSTSWAENCSGSGRKQPLSYGEASIGCEEGCLSDFDGVESVEIFQRGRDAEFSSLCPGGLVYNLEVEGTHTYFAEGVAVHNCHHAIAGGYMQLIQSQPQAKLLGVTASPERLDGRGLGDHAGGCFDDLILGPQSAELIEDGYLTPIRVFAPAHGPDLSGIKTRGGDYAIDELAKVMSARSIVGDACAEYAKHAPGQPAIVFCVSVEHAKVVAAAFRSAGWRAVAIDGASLATERDAALGGLATGAVQVLCVCDIVSEGLDVVGISVVILLRATKSLVNFIQWIGRGLRPVYAPGMPLETAAQRRAAIAASSKPYCLVLDNAGCVMHHGFPTEHRDWSLDGRPKKEAAPPTRQCPECFSIFKPAPVCPECGHSFAKEDKAKREIEIIEGELQEIDAARMDAIRNKPLHELLTGRETMAELTEIGKAKGYAKGFAWKMMQKRRGRAA